LSLIGCQRPARRRLGLDDALWILVVIDLDRRVADAVLRGATARLGLGQARPGGGGASAAIEPAVAFDANR
jgi:hypothetical protein